MESRCRITQNKILKPTYIHTYIHLRIIYLCICSIIKRFNSCKLISVGLSLRKFGFYRRLVPAIFVFEEIASGPDASPSNSFPATSTIPPFHHSTIQPFHHSTIVPHSFSRKKYFLYKKDKREPSNKPVFFLKRGKICTEIYSIRVCV